MMGKLKKFFIGNPTRALLTGLVVGGVFLAGAFTGLRVFLKSKVAPS